MPNYPYDPSYPLRTYPSTGTSQWPSYSYNQYQQMYANQAPQPMPMSQQQMSMNSRHSVTDRAIAELEQMDTYSDYERKILSDLIKKIESN